MDLSRRRTSIFNFLRRQLVQRYRAEHMLAPWVAKTRADSWRARLVPNPDQYTSPTLRHVEREDMRLELDLSDLMEWHLYYDFVDPSLENLLALCQEGDVVMDVGANIGGMLFKLSQRVGKTGRVLGFEPDPGRHFRCASNLARNNFSNVDLFLFGFGDSAGFAIIKSRNQHNQGMNQIVGDTQVTPLASANAIELRTIDTFAEQAGLEKLNVLKVDVEGYEFKVLKGAEGVLRKFKPALFVEVDEANLIAQGSSPQELIDFLLDLGYSPFANRIDQPLPDLKGCHFDLVSR